MVQPRHPYMITGKAIALTRQTLVGKAMSLLFNILSRLVIAFLPRSKFLLIICSDFGAQENKICHCFIVSPSICYEMMGPDAMILVFWRLSFKPAFSLSSFIFVKMLFISSSLCAIKVVSNKNIWNYNLFILALKQFWVVSLIH